MRLILRKILHLMYIKRDSTVSLTHIERHFIVYTEYFRKPYYINLGFPSSQRECL